MTGCSGGTHVTPPGALSCGCGDVRRVPATEKTGRYGDHPDTVQDGLRLIADWMDEADQLIDRVFTANGQVRRNRGDQVQQDVRRLAEWFTADPAAAADAWATVTARPTATAPEGQWPPDVPTDRGDDGKLARIRELTELSREHGIRSVAVDELLLILNGDR